MKLRELLQAYDHAALEGFAAHRLDGGLRVHLPREVLIDEIHDALTSLSYVKDAVALRPPPCFEILDRLLLGEDHRQPVEGFRASVHQRIEEMNAAGDALATGSRKEYALYLRLLEAAWQSGEVDSSEASLLTALRRELAIGLMEHVALEHHERIRRFWLKTGCYRRERNHLLAVGLVHAWEDREYVLADELVPLVRRVWSIDLRDEDFGRLLDRLNVQRLAELAAELGLPGYGRKEERIARFLDHYVEPREVLQRLRLDELRHVARESGAAVSGSKDELIDRLIEHFDAGADCRPAEAEPASEPPPVQPKRLAEVRFRRLFDRLSHDQLYQVACRLPGLRKSGSKEVKVSACWESPWSEESLLAALTVRELQGLLEGVEEPVSGPKSEKVARLIDWAATVGDEVGELSEASPAPQEEVEEEIAAEMPVQDEPAAAPAGDSIEDDLSFLDREERVVFGALREQRQMTEAEVEKLVLQKEIAWFLIKAHMLELIRRLEGNGKPFVRLRSRGGTDLYEFVGQGG